MLKTLWFVDGALLMLALGFVLMNSGQDAAGRGIMWFFPLAMAIGLGGSWLLERGGSHKAALICALVAPLLVGTIFLSLGRSLLAERREKSGTNYWSDQAQQQLAKAISTGDSAGIEAAAKDANVNAKGTEGMTPLSFAIGNKADVVPLLLKLGADPNAEGFGSRAPLALAVSAFDPAFGALLDAGADPNGPGEYDSPVIFTAIRGRYESRTDMLIARGADVKLLDSQGRSTLMAAVLERQWKTARSLLQKGVDRTIAAQDGSTLASILERMSQGAESDPEFAAFTAELAARTTGTP